MKLYKMTLIHFQKYLSNSTIAHNVGCTLTVE